MEISTVCAHDGNEQQRRRKRLEGKIGRVKAGARGERLCEKEHEEPEHDADAAEERARRGEHLACAAVIPHGDAFAHHFGDGRRQPGGGDHKEAGIIWVGDLIVAHALRADLVCKRHAEQRADDLYDKAGDAEDRCALNERGLFLFHIKHTCSNNDAAHAPKEVELRGAPAARAAESSNPL